MTIDLKSLEVLEQKIQRTVELVSKLKDENASLKSRLKDLEVSSAESTLRSRQLESMKMTHEQLEKEVKALQEERKTVLSRVDGLLEGLAKLQLD